MTMRHVISLIFLIPLVLLLGSHFGAVHPLGDSLAVFRGPLAVVGGISALILVRLKPKGAGVVAAVLVVWSAYTVLAPKLAFSSALDAPYALYQKNMRFDMASTVPLQGDILEHNPDFVTLQEVSANNLPILASLKEQYPAQVFCSFAGVGGVAVAARWPMVAGSGRCEEASGMAAMQLETPHGPVWLVSLHLHWPYPMGQAAQVRALVPMLVALEGPVVLGGDFNMVPWSHTMRSITAATDTQRVGAPKYTFWLAKYYSLPIDHVLINTNSRPADTWKRPQLGSDHNGVLARFYIR
ncbi:MAG: endonuclease [Marinosulfonomonas sp.]|nr:MAG: endonuclease [Marinosulfonomonas sp.]